jgi:sterol desaturase/sphingolipid hydroxylase (fatty acid hydroxylase superfamily)
VKEKSQNIIVFKNPLLEGFTHVDPRTPLIIWLPIISFLSWRALFLNEMLDRVYVSYAIAGLISWTFVEYAVHRWFFHFDAKKSWTKRMVFIFHGLHHDDPDDKTRLVMPPLPGILYSSILYIVFRFIFGPVAVDAFYSWFLLGYLLYDYIHYGIHHFNLKSSAGKYLRRHHLQHHVHDSTKFGVSSSLWDILLSTNHKKSKKFKRAATSSL